MRYQLAPPRLAAALSTLVDLELEIERHHADLDGRDLTTSPTRTARSV